jgi:transcriptional regulator GlxA family with amidase domain
MTRLLPRDLKKALDRLEADPGRIWNVDELAVACGMARRTLYKHFSRFLNRTPMEFLRELRLDRARQELLRARSGTSVTDVATRYGFTHLGRFATFTVRGTARAHRRRCGDANVSSRNPPRHCQFCRLQGAPR